VTARRVTPIRRGHPLLRGALANGGAAERGWVSTLRRRAEVAAQLCQLAQLRRQGLLTPAECDAATSRLLSLADGRRRS